MDVIIVGAGIVGIAIAHELLRNTPFSVALLDAEQPCAGATGAGQGYIWMAHRSPGTPGWELARRSKRLWEELVHELGGLPPAPGGSHPLGWQATGSLLVGTTADEAAALRARVAALTGAGVEARFLGASELRVAEPHLAVPDAGGAALVPGDSQLDARSAVAFLLERCRACAASGRYRELFRAPVRGFMRSPGGEVAGVMAGDGEVRCRQAVVVAAGAWSGLVTQPLAEGRPPLPVVPPVRPRKGHLLVLDGLPPGGVPLRHAIMEAEYTANYGTGGAAAAGGGSDAAVAVSMTATMDAHGRLLIAAGSLRASTRRRRR